MNAPQIYHAAEVGETLGQQYIAYLDASPQSVATYTASLRPLFLFLEKHGIKHPTKADILEYRKELKAQYAPATVSLRMTAARLFFQWTAEAGLYPNIANRIKGAKIDRGHKKDYLSINQVKNIINLIPRDTIQGKRDYAIFLCMITGGIRCIEITRANTEDFVESESGYRLYIQGKGKDERTEYFKIPHEVAAAILDYIKSKKAPSAALFTSESNKNSGGRLTARSISRLVKSRMIQAGYNTNRLTAHSLRHTAATLNIIQGGTPEETQQLLRHSNINTTLIYCHTLRRDNNNSEQRIADAIL